jgi:hypothetical protein
MSEQKCKINLIELIYSSKIQNNEEKIHKKNENLRNKKSHNQVGWARAICSEQFELFSRTLPFPSTMILVFIKTLHSLSKKRIWSKQGSP